MRDHHLLKRQRLLTRKHSLPISFVFDLARLGFETWMVIGLRTAKLAMGGPAEMRLPITKTNKLLLVFE
jgi:hypothetical protein